MSRAFSKILVLVIAIILIGGGIFAWQYFGSPEEEKETPAEEFVDETADWQTYTNEEYGFEMRYPGNYVIEKTMAKNNQFATFNVDNLQIVIYPTDLSLDKFVEDKAQGYLISNYQKISFLGQDAYEGINQGIINSYEIVAKNKGYIYELVFNTNNKGTLPELKAGLTIEQNQMLSTFKFIEVETIKNETADWKTYKNEEYGFEMKYPEDFLPTQPLQPKTKIIQCSYANFANECPFVPIEGFTGTEENAFRQGFVAKPTPERITVNNVPFCRQENREGAMGTSYITYNYTTVREEVCFVVSFTVPYPNCSNYLPIEDQGIQEVYDKCRLDNEVTKPETINKILSTFRFLE